MVNSLIRGLFLMRWKLISRPQVGGQSLGKYRCSWATRPPRAGPRSSNMTSYPASAASTDAVMPAIPPPTTRIVWL